MRGVITAAAAAVLLGITQTQSPAQLFRVSDYSGEEIFGRFCASCHGSEGRGDGPVAATLNVVVPDLTTLNQRYGDRFPAGDVREIIDGRSAVMAHGTRVMPVWGYEFWVEEGADVIAEAEARAIVERLVRYIEELQIPATDPALPR